MDGIAAVLPFAIGVAISPVPIIAVILMLFSSRAKVNGPMFALGWAVALAVVSGCKPRVGGETQDWQDNQKKVTEYSEKYDNFRKYLAEASLHGARASLVAAVGYDHPAYTDELPPLLPTGDAAAWRTGISLVSADKR